jgi:putative ABC transport system permease protein
MSFVLAMARRELRASSGRLLVFFLCISIGVGSIVALRSLIENVRSVFAQQARALIAADLVLSSNQPLPPALARTIADRLQAHGAVGSRGVELATMVRPSSPGSDVPARMVELRAVEQGFPYYGTLELQDGPRFDHGLLRGFRVLVRPELLSDLGLRVGDALLIGSRRFTIAGVIGAEPGRRLGAFSLGPRVFVDLADLEQTGLLAYGSRATYQWFVKLPEARLTLLSDALTTDLKNSFVRLRSFRTTEGDIGDDFGRAENYLSLVGLVILILGGIGVSSVTSVFVQQKVRSIAVLKCLGARSSQVLSIYLLQVLALGGLGSLLGVLLAGLAIASIPAGLLADATPGLQVSYRVTGPAAAQGIGIGLLVSLLFSIVPLLAVRRIKPALLLRDEPRPAGIDRLQGMAGAAVVAGLIGLTVWQAGSLRIGVVVAGGFVITTLVLQLMASALIRALAPLSAVRWFPLRHAVLKLIRPGGQARMVMLAVGLGSFFTLGVRGVQELLIAQLSVDLENDAPDMFLVDVQADQREAVLELLRAELGSGAKAAWMGPVLRARVTSVKGRELRLADYEDVRGRGSLGREYTITYRARLAQNERVIAGQFWDATPSAAGEVSIEKSLHERHGIAIGDSIGFDVLGRSLSARVTSIRDVHWRDTRAGGFMFVFRPGLLDQAPHAYVGFFRGPESAVARARLGSALIRGFPNVSMIDGRELLVTVRRIVDMVATAVSVVGAVVLLSGALILVGAVAMSKYRRRYEVAIFKTLGATRGLVAATLLLEYAVLGILSGAVGSLGAMGLTWATARLALDMQWRALPWLSAAGVAGCAVLVALVGVLGSWDVIRQRPLSTLRAE